MHISHDSLATIDNRLGVAIAVIGTIAAAPDGVRHIIRSTRSRIANAHHTARGLLKRMIPAMRRDQTITVHGISAGMSLGSISVTATGYAWPSNGSDAEKIEALRNYSNTIEQRLNEAVRMLRTEISERTDTMAHLEQAWRQGLADLRRHVDEREQEGVRIDARVLPLIGLGILLSGLPHGLADVWWPVALFIPAFSIVLSVVVTSRVLLKIDSPLRWPRRKRATSDVPTQVEAALRSSD